MPRAKLNLPKFTGVLAKPIESKFELAVNPNYVAESIEKRRDDVHRQQVAKLPALANAFGIKFDHLDLKSHAGLVSFYGCLVLNLAQAMKIPGFLEKSVGKWPRLLVAHVLGDCERAKHAGKAKSDLEVCLWAVKALDPEMEKTKNRRTAMSRAKQLCNRVSALRQKWKKDHADAQRKLLRYKKLKLVSQR
jgi:hypothetical protein